MKEIEELLFIMDARGKTLRAIKRGSSVIPVARTWTANNMQDSEDFCLHQPWDMMEDYYSV